VPELVRRLRIAYGKIPQAFGKDPVQTFRDHVWVTPFMEDHIAKLAEVIGADRILFGSDWPHPEGVTEPVDFLDDFASLGADDQRRILSDNLRGLLGLA
jgi:predicted TIM-barrel fold metal-dependent hydrolase